MGNKSSSFSGKMYGGIAERADFSLHGPKHLPTNWWATGSQHEYAVAACFINGVYILENDRQEGRSCEATASPWWESFGYTLLKELINPDNDEIFGAIYQRNPDVPDPAPFMVVALGGMVTDCDRRTMLSTLSGGLLWSRNFEVVLEHMGFWLSLVARTHKVWLCGHSLGAAIGLLAGKIKAKKGIYFDTFLFNPPIVLDTLGKSLFRVSTLVNPLLSIAVNFCLDAQRKMVSSDEGHRSYENLVDWEPRFLLNPGDPICSGYINYHAQRAVTLNDRLINLPKWILMLMPNQETTVDPRYAELHLPYVTPSAFLILNQTNKGEGECHGIKQWWDDDLNLTYRLYQGPEHSRQASRTCILKTYPGLVLV